MPLHYPNPRQNDLGKIGNVVCPPLCVWRALSQFWVSKGRVIPADISVTSDYIPLDNKMYYNPFSQCRVHYNVTLQLLRTSNKWAWIIALAWKQLLKLYWFFSEHFTFVVDFLSLRISNIQKCKWTRSQNDQFLANIISRLHHLLSTFIWKHLRRHNFL